MPADRPILPAQYRSATALEHQAMSANQPTRQLWRGGAPQKIHGLESSLPTAPRRAIATFSAKARLRRRDERNQRQVKADCATPIDSTPKPSSPRPIRSSQSGDNVPSTLEGSKEAATPICPSSANAHRII